MNELLRAQEILRKGTLTQVEQLIASKILSSLNFPRGRTALFYAAENKKKGVFEYLYEQVFKINNPNIADEADINLVIAAAVSGNTQTVRYLVVKGADPEAKDSFQRNVYKILEDKEFHALAVELKKIVEERKLKQDTQPPETLLTSHKKHSFPLGLTRRNTSFKDPLTEPLLKKDSTVKSLKAK